MQRLPATTISRFSISASKCRWLFISPCSFTTYALSHNIGGSVISGAVIRYRAYGSKGLTAAEVGVLVAICWFTFVPRDGLSRQPAPLPARPRHPPLRRRCRRWASRSAWASSGSLFVALYVFGSWLHLKPLNLGRSICIIRASASCCGSCTVGPAGAPGGRLDHLFRAAGSSNPGYLVVLGVFIISFSVAQLSHAPGGLGVFEFVVARRPLRTWTRRRCSPRCSSSACST